MAMVRECSIDHGADELTLAAVWSGPASGTRRLTPGEACWRFEAWARSQHESGAGARLALSSVFERVLGRAPDHADARWLEARLLDALSNGNVVCFHQVRQTALAAFSAPTPAQVPPGGGPAAAAPPAAPPPAAAPPAAPPPAAAPAKAEKKPEEKKEKELLTIEWGSADVWCGDKAVVKGTTKNYANDEEISIEVAPKAGGAAVTTLKAKVSGNAFSHNWDIKDVLPPTKDTKKLELDAKAGGKTTPKPLTVHFAPDVTKAKYASGHARFEIESDDYKVKIVGAIEYAKGWGGQVVKLGAAVDDTKVSGLVTGLTWAGYRWMKKVGTKSKFWDGTAWKDLPAGFVLADSNNFAVGFTKSGTKFACQYGGEWPEAFTDWNIDGATPQDKITKWKDAIQSKWTGAFDMKPKECKSGAKACCRYSTTCECSFTKKDPYAKGMIIVADGDIRSNDSLWFLGEARLGMAPHEFGHHLGNPDEYAGAKLDTTLNDDGASNGIDANSIMGQNLTTVKKRHFKTICKHFGDLVKKEHGKTYSYEAVPK